MLKNTTTRKFLSIVLAIVLIAISVVPAYALEAKNINIIEDTYNQLSDNDLFIPENIASYIARFFIDDMVATGNTKWSTETKIESVKTLYDETGEAISGYSIELNQGYIVVSAYIDMPSIILEWSDVAEPLYDEYDGTDIDKIIYANTLEYYCVDKTQTLRAIDGTEVVVEDLHSTFKEMRNKDNIDTALLDDIVSFKEETGVMPCYNGEGEEITDVYAYAKNVYGGTWKSHEWANNWEKYMNFSATYDFPGYDGHCGPTAITNIIKSYGNKYNNSSIKSTSSQKVFEKLMEVNAENNGDYYASDGTTVETTPDFIKKGFAKFGVTMQVYGMYTPTYYDIQNAVQGYRLMYLIVWNNKPYSNHALVGYAYNRLINEKGTHLSFLKVADGWSHEGRYLPIASLSGDKYYEAFFS